MTGSAPSQSWWEMFEDPQLNHFVDLGLVCNPDIKLAQARIDYAYQQALEDRARLLPTFELFGSYYRQKESAYDIGIPAFVPLVIGKNLYFNTAAALLRGSYEVDLWGKNRNRYYADLGMLQAQIADKAQARLTLAAAIVETYFNLQNHLNQYEILVRQYEAKKMAYTLLYQRFYHGMDDEFFVYIFDKEASDIQDNIEIIKGIIESDRHAFAALVGNVASCCNESGEICVELSASYMKRVELPTCLPIDLLARRPDVIAALWVIQSKSYGIKVAKAQFFPNLDLSAFIGSTSFLVTKFFTYPALKLFGDAQSRLPLYTGGALSANLGKAQADIEIAVERYNQTLLTAVKNVEDAMTSLKTADNRMGKIKEAVKDSRDLYELTNQKYQHGIDSNVRAMNALSNLDSQLLLESEIQLARMVAIVDVIRSIGGGYCGN